MKIFTDLLLTECVILERPHVAVRKTAPKPLEPATPSGKALGAFVAFSIVNVLRVQTLLRNC